LDYRHGHRRHSVGHSNRLHGALMRLIPVDPKNETHVRFLYELFLSRPEDAKISCKGAPPSYEEHRHFVENHPYADWSLIETWRATNADGMLDFFIGAVFISRPARPSVVGDELSVDIHPDFRGSGYAEEALRLMMEKHAPRRFIANVAPENYASMALFKKLGFKLCQVTFDHFPPLVCAEVTGLGPEGIGIKPGEVHWTDDPA
jgi:RimJ/RimL family protein N-acetyltransferase